MRVLGIDPGLRLTGYAVLEGDPGSLDAPVVVEAGTLRLDPRRSVADRLVELERDLRELIGRTAPDAAAVEAVFVHGVHPMTGVVMGHARGVVLLTLRRAGLEITELKPTEVKKCVCGNGHARKAQVQASIAALLRLSEPPDPPDVADAMAVALCALGRAGNVE
ncbi:MAG: crossover junction endodeoxyribonuclease RuvC [Planctomycetes bacterium]|nr:crossover junction endodeoxyribonuclease RuvC [Planctomycetota bacterium]